MFEKELSDRLKRIFDFKKTRYDDPSESMEQECLFINIESANCDISEKRQRAQVRGQLFAFANLEKLPYGYFSKRIAQSNPVDTAKFFFHETDLNAPVTNNIVRRSLRFVFFYEAQYDPNLGMITSVNFLEGEEP